MVNLKELLQTKEFWYFYQLGPDYRLDEQVVKRFAPLKNDNQSYNPVTILLECAPPFALDVEVTLDSDTVNLFLTNREQNKRSELGWWDDARWHPFALRWEEILRLARFWDGHPPSSCCGSVAALLLLARFVGNGVDEKAEFTARRQRVTAAYHELELFSPGEIDELVEATLLKPPDDDYRWTRDPTRGWVFGGDYPCYSIRNAAHADGSEGRFPFTEWERLLASI